MKILIINKKYFLNIFLLFCICLCLYIFTKNNYFTSTISPVSDLENFSKDLNGDGIPETLSPLLHDNTVDFLIKTPTNDYYLSKELPDNKLFTSNSYWIPKVYLNNISRDNTTDIILQGCKNNKSMVYIYHWNSSKFSLIYSSSKNIFGILDSKNTKTPQCYSLLASDGISSLNSFMLINNEVLDTTKENSSLPSLETCINFINIIEKPYELEELPDIFATSIDTNQLSLFWNLDKDHYSYSLQNCFFSDYKWDKAQHPVALTWRLAFEKNKLTGSEKDKDELILLLDIQKIGDSFKITSIDKLK